MSSPVSSGLFCDLVLGEESLHLANARTSAPARRGVLDRQALLDLAGAEVDEACDVVVLGSVHTAGHCAHGRGRQRGRVARVQVVQGMLHHSLLAACTSGEAPDYR
jgi:hypothetical protein